MSKNYPKNCVEKGIANYYNYLVINIGDEKEEGYEAIIPKFPNITIYGDPIDTLHETVLDAIEYEIKERKKDGRPIPPPDTKPSADFKGKIILRTTPELHEKLYREAKINQLSLNKYIEKKLQS